MKSSFSLRGSKRLFSISLFVIGLALISTSAYVWVHYFKTKEVLNIPALPQAAGATHAAYSFSIYGVDGPVGVALSPDGQRLYVSEATGERMIKVFDNTGKSIGAFAPPGVPPANRQPLYMVVAQDGTLFVTDLARNSLDFYSPDGQMQGSVVPKFKGNDRWRPLAVTMDKQGRLYVSDVANEKHRILILERDGAILGQIDGDFAYPNGLAIANDGTLYVSDTTNGRIQAIDQSGQVIGSVRESGPGVTLGLPKGLALDSQGRLDVVDTFDHGVIVYSTGKPMKVQFKLGHFGLGDGEFAYPSSLAVDSKGRLFITDRENNRVQVWF